MVISLKTLRACVQSKFNSVDKINLIIKYLLSWTNCSCEPEDELFYLFRGYGLGLEDVKL